MTENAEKKGFAKLDPETLKEISSRGGKAAQAGEKPYRFTSETAKKASKLSRGGNRFTSETGRQASEKAKKVREEKQG